MNYSGFANPGHFRGIYGQTFRHVIAISLLAGVSPTRLSAATLTYKDLVKRLTDLECLAVLPPAGEKGALASSYDRASRYDAATDKYIDWSANRDGGGIIRKEGDSSVLAEIEGPGSIWRMWTATAKQGHVKFYLDGATTPAIDLLMTEGKGRYVGTQLHIWNPHGGWWGEGDEKFFVDGEKFPSTLGTGSEDYFGYAWSSGRGFVQALHSQPVNENNEGHVSVNRWHIADNIPFQTSFEGAIEKHFNNNRNLYASVAFWYLNAGGKDPYGTVPVSERAGWWVRPELYQEAGAIEGESLKALGKPLHNLRSEAMWSSGEKAWSGDHQLYWSAEKAGDTIDLEIPPRRTGKYRVLVRFTKGPFYGNFQLSLNKREIGVPIDFFASRISAMDPLDLGEIDLPAGETTLTMEATGKNEASKGLAFGLDYIKLMPA